MGFLDERYATFLTPLFRQTLKEKAELHEGGDDESQADFELADVMERGLARELVADFLEPLPDSSVLWKFHVERSDDRREYRLFCDGGEFLMYAKASRDCRRIDIFMYDPEESQDHQQLSRRPAFSMHCSADRQGWRLSQDRCDVCRHAVQPQRCTCGGRCPQLLTVKHSSVDIGEGINHCMDVCIPAASSTDGQEKRFITKLPVWNEKVQCLVLDFTGRSVQASAKNFQVALEEDEGERVVCQYGKIDSKTFSLDFRYPLTVSQAFGMALSTLFWD